MVKEYNYIFLNFIPFSDRIKYVLKFLEFYSKKNIFKSSIMWLWLLLCFSECFLLKWDPKLPFILLHKWQLLWVKQSTGVSCEQLIAAFGIIFTSGSQHHACIQLRTLVFHRVVHVLTHPSTKLSENRASWPSDLSQLCYAIEWMTLWWSPAAFWSTNYTTTYM